MKVDKNQVYIIIPAYNEGQVIGSVIDGIKKEGFKNIIVVDDGSTDNTSEIAKRKGCIVLKHIINRGKGAAIKTGLEYVKKINGNFVITIDGDGQHNCKDINKIFDYLQNGYDVVLGSRLLNKKNKMPLFNLIANYFANFITYLLYDIFVSDSQSGFRGYNKRALKLINTNYDQYEIETEILGEIRKNQLKYIEVPIDVFYTKYSKSKKKKQSLVNGFLTFFNLAK